MKTDKELLSSVLKTTQMGQVGIGCVLPYATRQAFKDALHSQKKEYDAIEQEAHNIAMSRGWELQELQPGAKLFSSLCAKTSLMYQPSDSKIAAMMINGSTKGVIKGIKNLHHERSKDQAITQLSEKLIDCEQANIRQMQGYL